MSISPRQFDQLTEMGISLWQSRPQCNENKTEQNNYLLQDQQSLTNLSKQRFFKDILLSMDVTIGEINVLNDHLDVGLFNWYFRAGALEDSTEESAPLIYCTNNKLVSPSIDLISQSASLKKQLWHTISNHLLS